MLSLLASPNKTDFWARQAVYYNVRENDWKGEKWSDRNGFLMEKTWTGTWLTGPYYSFGPKIRTNKSKLRPVNHEKERFRKELSFRDTDVLILTLPYEALKSMAPNVSVMIPIVNGIVIYPFVRHMDEIILATHGQWRHHQLKGPFVFQVRDLRI